MNSFYGKTVLVTGATGLIGSHLVDALMLMENVNVIALSRSKEKLEKGFAEYIGRPNFQYISQDIAEPLKLKGTIVDFVFHAAGPMERTIVFNYPLEVINANIIGTENCLNLLFKQQKEKNISGRLIIFSSVTVYGNNTDHDIKVTEEDTDITETLVSNSAPYSQSKRMSEVIALAHIKQCNSDAVIARFSTVYGNTRYMPDAAFFEFIKKAVAGEDIILNGNAFARRDNIYVNDAVKAILLLAIKGKTGEAYNISSGAELGNFAAVDEIASTIAKIANKKYGRSEKEIVHVIRRIKDIDGRKAGLILDNSKLKSLGWKLETSVEQGIMKTMEDYELRNAETLMRK